MKNFSTLINEGAKTLDIAKKTINYISVAELKKYLKIASKFISEDAKTVVNWLIVNNASYIKDLTKPKKSSGNALADFYSKGTPKEESYKELYKCIGTLNKKNRILEIPVFMTEEQFKGIISGKISPDEIFLDLTTEAGRTKIYKQYEPLINKIAYQYWNKMGRAIPLEDLQSAGSEGLVKAMNTYGKPSKAKDDDEDEDVEDDILSTKDKKDLGLESDDVKIDARKAFTFTGFAAKRIQSKILKFLKRESRLVRVPDSAQRKEREETGKNSFVQNVSGDTPIGSDKDGNEGKTLWDMLGYDSVDAETNINRSEIEALDKKLKKASKERLDARAYDILTHYFGVWGAKKMENKELAKKHRCGASNISTILHNTLKQCLTDKVLGPLWKQMKELHAENESLIDRNDNDPYTVGVYENESID